MTNYRSLRQRGRGPLQAMAYLVRVWVAIHTPLRATLVWHALRGHSIIYRATFEKGICEVPGPSLIAGCTIIGPWESDGPVIRIGASDSPEKTT